MGILAWLFMGLIAGFVARKLVNKTGAGASTDIVLGIIGAMIVLVDYHAMTRRGVS